MSDATITALVTAGTALVTAIGAFARWALKLWAQVRREAIAAQRGDNERMVNALLEQAKSNTTLAGKIDLLSSRIDAIGARVHETEQELELQRAQRITGATGAIGA